VVLFKSLTLNHGKGEKKPKKRAEQYDPKLGVKGKFVDMFKIVKKNKEDKKNEKK
jgi:hypothetical protein